MRALEERPETTELFQYVELLAAAETLNEVLRAVRDYLNAWHKERIRNLQKVDGGWAPFDREQMPAQIDSVVHLRRFQDAVHRQCAALKQAGMEPTPEIIELNEFLFIAVRLADCMKTHPSKARSTASGTHSRLLNLL